MSLQGLADAIEQLDACGDAASVKQLLWLRDRFEAKVTDTLIGFDRDLGWAFDQASSLQGWLRTEARVSDRDACRLVHTARTLAAMGGTHDAWRTGALSGGQVDLIVTAASRPRLPVLVKLDATIVEQLTGADLVETKAAIRRLAGLIDDIVNDGSDGTTPEVRGNRLQLSQTLDGRWKLTGDLDAATGELFQTALRLAASTDGDIPAAQRAGDAVGTVAGHFVNNHDRDNVPPPRPGQRRNRPHVHVIIGPDGRAETDHGVRIPHAVVERLLCDARVNPIRFHDGHVLYYGRERRTATDAQYQALVVRDRHCRHPGCERPASWCDAHHAHPRENGGGTDIDNLVLLCGEHHHKVHQPGWHNKLLPDGTYEVTWPNGTTRSTRPPGNPNSQLF